MPDEISFSIAGEEVVALAEKALLWPRERTLFVADVHFGKDATFRRAQRWVPPGTTPDDLARLSYLVRQHQAKKLVILGDAFHSEHAEEQSTFDDIRRWREDLECPVLMVKGNHDLRATRLARRLDFEVVDEDHALGPWSLWHHPDGRAEGYILCGHLHPQASLRGPARQHLRVPCFWAGPRQCILPAFGGFTGGSTVRPTPGDQVILVAGGRLVDAALCTL